MEKEGFIKELLEKLEGRVSGKIQYLKKGAVSEQGDQLNLIRETNIKYFKTESDELLGDFLVVEPDGTFRQFCRFEGDYLFSTYEKKGWDGVWEIIDANLEQAQKFSNSGVMKLLEENDYDAIKDYLFIRPLNYQDHRYELNGMVYRRIGDIVLVLYLLVEDTYEGEHHNVSSVKIHRKQMEEWDISEDDVWEAAMGNTYLMAPPRMYMKPDDAYKPPYHKGAFMALGSKLNSISAYQVPTLTTTSQMNGAIAIFYPGVQEKIAEMFGDDYYVAFTSIHEARLHKKNTLAPIQILRQIKGVNKMFDPAEILTRKLYIYEKSVGELRQMDL